jgi:hypothetical protein
MLVHTPDQEQPATNGSHLDGMVEIGSLLQVPKATKNEAEQLKHLHVLVVEGELSIWIHMDITANRF